MVTRRKAGPVAAAVALICAGLVPSIGRLAAQSPPPNETGTAFYKRYQDVVQKATQIEEILALWSANLSRQFTAAPAAQRVDLAGLKRIYGLTRQVTVVKETPTPAGLTLSLEGLTTEQRKTTGTVRLVKEAGAWKIASQESWAAP